MRLLYVAGLIGPGDRKSFEPVAARAAPVLYNRLHHFIAEGVWNGTPLEAELAKQADQLTCASDAFLDIDHKSLWEKSADSAGGLPQHASMLGKQANCQILVSLTLARNNVPAAGGLRLFLPESWTIGPLRIKNAGFSKLFQRLRSKPDIALDEIERLIGAGRRFGSVLAGAGYGLSASFQQELRPAG